MQLSKAYAKKCNEYEQKLELLRQEANAVLESVAAPMKAASPSSVDNIEFPTESQGDIANLTHRSVFHKTKSCRLRQGSEADFQASRRQSDEEAC
jgi:ABC-type ATPase with predicted acetyltransferase domain